jgi:hypothetical protein
MMNNSLPRFFSSLNIINVYYPHTHTNSNFSSKQKLYITFKHLVNRQNASYASIAFRASRLSLLHQFFAAIITNARMSSDAMHQCLVSWRIHTDGTTRSSTLGGAETWRLSGAETRCASQAHTIGQGRRTITATGVGSGSFYG